MQSSQDPFYRAYLLEELTKRQKRRYNYSLRNFAKDLELHAPTLSNVLRGKRNLSFYSALKVTELLKIKDSQKEVFLKSVISDKKRGQKRPLLPLGRSLQVHDLFHDEIVADPIYFSIFSFLNSDVPVKNEQSIAASFGLSGKKTKELLAKLYAAKMIHFDGENIKAAASAIRSSDGVSSSAVKSAHKATLLNALKRLESVSIDFRNFRSLKFPLNTEIIPELTKEIHRFIDRIYKLSQKDKSKTQVYEIAVQLFPLSQIGESNE